MRALLDVNMLLAMFDRGHIFHGRAMAWWQANRADGWASCPITQNGYLRIVSSGSYSRPVKLATALRNLRLQVDEPDHAFWPDDISLLDPEIIDPERLLGPRQLSDVYLLALAIKHGGRLVTLDRSIPLVTIRGARPEHLVVVK